MNFVFISPQFPQTFWNFCDRLKKNGVNLTQREVKVTQTGSSQIQACSVVFELYLDYERITYNGQTEPEKGTYKDKYHYEFDQREVTYSGTGVTVHGHYETDRYTQDIDVIIPYLTGEVSSIALKRVVEWEDINGDKTRKYESHGGLIISAKNLNHTNGLIWSSNSDDDDRTTTCIFDDNLLGKWQFVEMLDGPEADFDTHHSAKQPDAHMLEFASDGRVFFTCYGAFPFSPATNLPNDGWEYFFPEEQESYHCPFPVVVIFHQSINMPGIPFGVECDGPTLKLHYLGTYFTDHIPETYVYRRVK